MNTPDLTTEYLGFKLRNPLVVSSCPLTGRIKSLMELEQHGAGAVVLPSLFQEQIEHEELEVGRLHEMGADSFPEAAGYFPELGTYNTGPDGYLKHVEEARAALSIPVIASLNGVSAEGFARYARRIESAGAHGIELNLFHVPISPETSGADVEAMYAQQVRAVCEAVSVPVSVKVGPHLSAPVHAAGQLESAGARGVVLFNRFLEPDIDLETLEVVPRLELTRAAEIRMPLRWVAILSSSSKLSLATTSGVHDAGAAIKLILAGADAVMVASVLLEWGPEYLKTLLREFEAWLVENEYESVSQMKGSMNHRNCPDPKGFERLNYMKALTSFTGTWAG